MSPAARAAFRLGAWALTLWLLWPAERAREPGPPAPLGERLLGPIASLAASVQWVRFDLALRDGRFERAYARADAALALDPVSPEGWLTLGRHLVTYRASPENEPDPARRAAWIRAGLEVLAEGERESNAPGELALAQGVFLAFYVAAIAGEAPRELDWPGGERGALEEAREAFGRAAGHGHPRAAAGLEAVEAALARGPR